MRLKVILPFQLFSEIGEVRRIVAETGAGSFGLLPHRLDCVAALTPGILVYQCADQAETYVAIDAGVLVKTGQEVLVSVRNAIAGTDLAQLRDAVERQFLTLDAHEQGTRAVLAKLESGFLHRFAAFQHE